MTSDFDYSAPAELFPAQGAGFRRKFVTYKRFDTAADALRYALEELSPPSLSGAVLEVNEDRFDCEAMRMLYTSGAYPLPRGKQPAPKSPQPTHGENDN